MIKTYQKGEILVCPFCGKHPAGELFPVEDFVVPDSDVGTLEDSECYACYGEFTVETLGSDKFDVYN